MKATPRPQGPWTHKVLVYGFSLVFGLLLYWLLGFVLRDIGTWPGPDYAALERQMIPPELGRDTEALQAQMADIQRAIAEQQQRQALLRDSTGNAEKTINQLLELNRQGAPPDRGPETAEQQALAASQRLFLTNQARYQAINERVATLSEQARELEARLRTNQAQLQEQRRPVQAEFHRQMSRHQLKLAALKLAFLLPLLALAVWLFLKQRGGLYAALIYGLGIATLIKVGWVMHEHFPTRYFKYVLIVAALLVVVRILVYLLQMTAHPRADWLLKQYREAYERFLCPVCRYPIRRGPLKYLVWSRRSLKKLTAPSGGPPAADEPYSCPVCGTRLFEECPACRTVRHALLPVCTHCGAEKRLAPSP